MRVAGARLTALLAADTTILVALRPRVALLDHLRAPHVWLAHDGVDGAAAEIAAAALWLTAWWLAAGLFAVAVAALPGGCGRAGTRIAAVLLPRTLYRLVAGAAGFGIALAPVAAGATAAPRSAAPTAPTASIAPTAPMWPAVPGRPASVADHRQSTPARGAGATSIVVERGDSLWAIAAAHLDHPAPARIAASWPRWYAANRAVIGPDPNHILAGQVLHIPAQRPEEGPP